MNPLSTATGKRASRSRAAHLENPRANRSELIASERQSPDEDRNELARQHLTIMLERITASDYLAWVRDPDPHTLGRELRSVDVHADPLGNRLEVLLQWSTDPPAPRAAAPAAGFHLTPEVIELRASHG